MSKFACVKASVVGKSFNYLVVRVRVPFLVRIKFKIMIEAVFCKDEKEAALFRDIRKALFNKISCIPYLLDSGITYLVIDKESYFDSYLTGSITEAKKWTFNERTANIGTLKEYLEELNITLK